jgi:hypothetical protein
MAYYSRATALGILDTTLLMLFIDHTHDVLERRALGRVLLIFDRIPGLLVVPAASQVHQRRSITMQCYLPTMQKPPRRYHT